MSKLYEDGKPMMADREIQIIDDLIEKHQVKRVLEWGSGNSTTYFSEKHECIKEWVAVEHAEDYFEIIRDRAKTTKNEKVNIRFIPEERSYINEPLLWGKFDFIFVDGIYRYECLSNAFKIVEPKGIILLHDWSRKESQGIMEKYGSIVTILCDGELPQPDGFKAHRGLAQFNVK